MADETSIQSINKDSLTIHSTSGMQDAIKDESNKPDPLNILTSHQDIKIDEQFVFKLSKGSKNASKAVKNSCKVLHLSSEWSFEEILAVIDGLDTKEYPQLFIFVIEVTNVIINAESQENSSRNLTKLQKNLLKFGSTRPIILQLTSGDENVSKIYYQEKSSYQFIAIDRQQDESEEINPFSSFLVTFLDESLNNFEVEVFDSLSQLQNRSLILRFLRTLDQSDGFFGGIVLEIATKGTKSEFSATLDSPFDSDGRILSNRAKRYISNVFGDDDDVDTENDDSVLLRAIQNMNAEVIDYLITYWIHLIQQLPFDHQVKISTAALETNQIDVLCDLLDIADFPFPKDFKIDSVNHERLLKIVADRNEFQAAIEREDFGKIDEFINNNSNLKFIYNPSNNSALTEAFNLKKFPVFYYLKSLGFKGEKCDDILKKLSKEEKEQAVKLATEQRKKNVNKSQILAPNTVMLLSTRSSIHNSRTEKLQVDKYREKIIKWLEDIHKVAPELIGVAASCEELMLIFDFESDNVENASLTGSNSAGSTYPSSKQIFMGAKLLDNQDNQTMAREQYIKGVLAHELCHFVMRLVYENQENPYFKDREDMKDMFEEIVKIIDKWSAEDSECPDDECNGTISTVFTLYPSKDFHPELIVRVVQILAEFDDDEEKSKYLQDKYKILFNFWDNQVILDLKRFDLKSRETIRKMNRIFELLINIKSKLYSLNEPKDIKALFDSQSTVVTTNVPMLLLNDIYNYLQDNIGDLLDTENIFVDPEVLKNKEILQDFTNLLRENPKLNILVDCSSELPENIIDFQTEKTIYVVSSEAQHEKLLKILNDLKTNPTKIEINYNWSDLTLESQELLIETEVSFQNWSELSLLELLMPGKSYEESRSCESFKNAKNQVMIEFSEVLDDKLLNLMVEGSDIFIDVQQEGTDDQDNKNFDSLFIEREFIRKTQELNQEKKESALSLDELFAEVQDKPVVLISDIAGNGKSWVMKKFADTFKDDDFVKWVTYVDLKQFIDKFKAQKGEPEFSTFIIKNMLKLEHNFEAKIFQKLYNDGKVLILFDGFDEIAPDCAEFVSKLAQNFKQNNGNQLWIATRDFFEIDLQQKLQIDAVYKIRELSIWEGISLIVHRWILMENDNKLETVDEFDNFTDSLDEQYSNYRTKAYQIVQNFHFNWFNPVGMPLLFNMIAEDYKNDKDGFEISLTIIFKKYIIKLCKMWSHEKGQIREEAYTESIEFNFSFWKIHQYHAIASLFPELVDILFPGYDRSEWPDAAIVACSLMTKIGENITFVHETLREFFVADFIAKAIKNPKIKKEIIEIFNQILGTEKFLIIRIFLNDLVEDFSNLKKSESFDPNLIFVDERSRFTFQDLFIELLTVNEDKLADFFVEIMKTFSYERKKKILNETAGKIVPKLNDPKSVAILQAFIFDILNIDDLKDFIIDQGLLQGIISSQLEFNEFENFLSKIEAKTDRMFVKKAFTTISDLDGWKGNIFHHLSQSLNFSLQKLQKTIQICKKFFDLNEICGLFKNCNQNKETFLHLVFKNRTQNEFKEIWREIENFHSTSELFKELAKQEDSQGFTVLHHLGLNTELKFHEDLWKVLLITFEDREELKEFILKNDRINESNYIHKLISQNSNADIIKLTFKILKEDFTDAQFTEIIKSRKRLDSNLLLTASFCTNEIEIYKFLWTFFKDFCGSNEEFLKMVTEVDVQKSNILELCVVNSPKEIFEFMIEEIENLTTRDEIRKMLSNLNNWETNLMQRSALMNNSPDLHESIWKVFRKYFEASEIVNFIHQVDKKYGENLLFFPFIHNSIQMLELTWNEIKKYLTYEEQVIYLKTENKEGKNLLERADTPKMCDHITEDKVEWVMSLFKEYNIDFTEQQLPSWYLMEKELKALKDLYKMKRNK